MDDGDFILIYTFMNFILTLYRWNVKAVHSTNVSNDFYK
jgi:hypothetical protein